MKITSLLIQYLYANQRLDLPGIGVFTLDRSVISQFDNPKHRVPITEGITFQSKPGLTDSPDLINFISTETGKMKSLAMADLDSRVELAKQFLNLGKPFTFEGLGTLVRRTTGEVEFTPAFIIPDGTRNVSSTGGFHDREEQPKKYESFLTEPKKSGNLSRPVLAGLVIGGIVLAIAAGYFISRPAGNGKPEVAASVAEPAPPAADTPLNTTAQVTPETTAVVNPSTTVTAPAPTPAAVVSSSNYKYVLEVAKSARAFKRYNQLRTNLWKVELETKDSIDYKLVLKLPAINADTTRIVDSLTVMLGNRVYIEHQN